MRLFMHGFGDGEKSLILMSRRPRRPPRNPSRPVGRFAAHRFGERFRAAGAAGTSKIHEFLKTTM